jgi:hypothetical protein
MSSSGRIAYVKISWRGQPSPTSTIRAPDALIRSAISTCSPGRALRNFDASTPAIFNAGNIRSSAGTSLSSVGSVEPYR